MSHNVRFVVVDHYEEYKIHLTLWGGIVNDLATLDLLISHNVRFIFLHLNIMRSLRWIPHCEEALWGGNVDDFWKLFKLTNLALWGIGVLGWEMSHNVGFSILHLKIIRNLRCISHCEKEMMIVYKSYIEGNSSIWLGNFLKCRIHFSSS